MAIIPPVAIYFVRLAEEQYSDCFLIIRIKIVRVITAIKIRYHNLYKTRAKLYHQAKGESSTKKMDKGIGSKSKIN